MCRNFQVHPLQKGKAWVPIHPKRSVGSALYASQVVMHECSLLTALLNLKPNKAKLCMLCAIHADVGHLLEVVAQDFYKDSQLPTFNALIEGLLLCL